MVDFTKPIQISAPFKDMPWCPARVLCTDYKGSDDKSVLLLYFYKDREYIFATRPNVDPKRVRNTPVMSVFTRYLVRNPLGGEPFLVNLAANQVVDALVINGTYKTYKVLTKFEHEYEE